MCFLAHFEEDELMVQLSSESKSKMQCPQFWLTWDSSVSILEPSPPSLSILSSFPLHTKFEKIALIDLLSLRGDISVIILTSTMTLALKTVQH